MRPTSPSGAVPTTRLRQVLINLVGNAIKFTETGEVRLCVRRQIDPWASVCCSTCMTVASASVRGHPRMFRSSSRPAPTPRASSAAQAWGWPSANVLSSMGGEISVGNEPGVGSTFSFWLPLELGTAPRSKPKIHKPHIPTG
ncbi:MAG: hypothetical protein IPH08_01195 [Rhodocyclaceae bacterium]|nr:hypothetical protein [Rhodocyclaceae bacterium]